MHFVVADNSLSTLAGPLHNPSLHTSSIVISSAASKTASLADCANAKETAIFSIGSALCRIMTLFSILAKPRLGPRLVAMPLMPACVVSAPLSESPRMAASLVPDALDDAIALNSPPPSTSTFSSSCRKSMNSESATASVSESLSPAGRSSFRRRAPERGKIALSERGQEHSSSASIVSISNSSLNPHNTTDPYGNKKASRSSPLSVEKWQCTTSVYETMETLSPNLRHLVSDSRS
mmetsp:Transcript_15917/g.43790  ORF Transcript_15917/g.43790 Transcript_15917/m.43790 type:complete len:236 (-) Transcript_15917:348-1055(-)